jgi:carbonic anhydrase/acetyltransferase-like protein (isoleucine patch superfamily)
VHHRREQPDRHGRHGAERRRIGRNCLVGANALIPEGKIIPDNSLVVGAPGRVVRQLDDEQLQRLRAPADIYRRNWRRFAQGMRRLD